MDGVGKNIQVAVYDGYEEEIHEVFLYDMQ